MKWKRRTLWQVSRERLLNPSFHREAKKDKHYDIKFSEFLWLQEFEINLKLRGMFDCMLVQMGLETLFVLSSFSQTIRKCQYWHFRLYCMKTKKIQWQNITPSGNRTQAASNPKSNTILSTLIWHVLLRRSLNICSCTTWYLNLDELRQINRAWLYKDPKVSVLQANVKLV